MSNIPNFDYVPNTTMVLPPRPNPSPGETALAKWQRLLRLQDWDITLTRVSADAIDDNWGRTHQAPQNKHARIQIVEDAEAGNASQLTHAFDAEETLVHELLHIHLNPWKAVEGMESDYKEAVIDQLATLLVRLERGHRTDYPLHADIHGTVGALLEREAKKEAL